MEIIIEPGYDGTTVREFVINELGLSRSMLTRLKKIDKGICLNDSKVTVRAVIRAGDKLTLATEDTETDVNDLIVPRRLPLDIIYEDEDIVAVNKSPDMPTHPSMGHPDDSLANAMAYYYQTKGTQFVFRAVNRLDNGTSGIVLIAKNRITAYRLSKLMMSGGIKKYYTAVASGRLPRDGGDIITYIRRKSGSIILREVCCAGEGGAYARTRFKTVTACNDYSIADVEPETGRTHQIRVHFSHIGHPLVGDYLYGTENEAEMRRHALHAGRIDFIHPSSGMPVTLSAPPPPDICRLINRLMN